ncbi:PEP-CTERM sorting domain-containing protein [Chroococcus sp. FPU101]|uniref:PEP-CTERM sorting domain-containing protein n=1 Tax=Chroococcus sp. FPU101 TaxID=1974212 RepID=UPI001A8D1D0A|nr:PEP-CTERM sorting domain-containing protein [Chroococcus sp. FPU101]GFE68550.1 hypothetical protein CFPU101_11600 [Chroococcus sp. FPU101]
MTNRFSVLVGSSVLAAGMITFSATDANALACSAGSVTYNGAAYNSCQGAFSGNLNPTQETSFLNDSGGLFAGITDWIYDRKINTPGSVENGANFLGFSITPTTGSTSGQWGFSNTSYTGPVVLALKAGQGRSYYYFSSITGANSLLGDWNTNGTSTNNSGRPQNLSHASLFYVEPSAAVPEPLTMLGVGAAAGFGAFFKKRLAKAQNKDI